MLAAFVKDRELAKPPKKHERESWNLYKEDYALLQIWQIWQIKLETSKNLIYKIPIQGRPFWNYFFLEEKVEMGRGMCSKIYCFSDTEVILYLAW